MFRLHCTLAEPVNISGRMHRSSVRNSLLTRLSYLLIRSSYSFFAMSLASILWPRRYFAKRNKTHATHIREMSSTASNHCRVVVIELLSNALQSSVSRRCSKRKRAQDVTSCASKQREELRIALGKNAMIRVFFPFLLFTYLLYMHIWNKKEDQEKNDGLPNDKKSSKRERERKREKRNELKCKTHAHTLANYEKRGETSRGLFDMYIRGEDFAGGCGLTALRDVSTCFIRLLA